MSSVEPVSVPEIQATPAPTIRRNPLVLRLLFSSVAILVLIVATALLFWYNRAPELHGTALQAPRPIDDFTLTGSNGQPLALSDLRGQWLMIYFGYTHCPDICPTTMADLAIMANELGEERMEDVQVLLVSVDPERDTPERLATYLQAFHPTFLGMTGDLATIQAAASHFGIYFEHTGEGIVDHTSYVLVVDPEGHLRLVYPYGVSGLDMAVDMDYLIRRG
jgi:protein SCO1